MEENGKTADLENNLNSFKLKEREAALHSLRLMTGAGELSFSADKRELNLHCHTFFSYNGYGYSPTYIAWWARKNGLFAAATVDFDVLDGVDEFLKASWSLNLRSAAGIETRVFIPELSAKEINSPGEPGIAYHCGMGFICTAVPKKSTPFLERMRSSASARTRDIVIMVNSYLATVTVDFDKDVLPLTPAGNVTERHVCSAYYAKAEQTFPDAAERTAFWSEKLQTPADKLSKIINDPVQLQNLIRSKTMKMGGAGYVKPDPKSFPELLAMNKFIKECGAIPVVAWLNGESAGEKDPDALIDLHMKSGAAAVNIIPDRNWNFPDAEVRKKKIAELHRFIESSKKKNLPILVGTEMNAPGQCLIDNFASEALKPYIDDFIEGAEIVFAHTLLQHAGMGYLSEWASSNFVTSKEKNAYFSEIGKRCLPSALDKVAFCGPEMSKDKVKEIIFGKT
ncbi:MAG TPA: hypothetical protein DCZ94_11070 [Lentisphaeria bacterium]|nr:MAG: hypothetical protein A2X48_06950 [Lentisphaerae bacterium GWF2_49_21]HBC87486.1 hypothetical protein [Lentisphaeria bacterium]